MNRGDDDAIEMLDAAPWPDDTGSDPDEGSGAHDEAARTRPRWVVPAFATVLALVVGGIAISVATDDRSGSAPPAVTPSTVAGDLPGQPTLPTIQGSTTLPEFPPALFPTGPQAVPAGATDPIAPKYVVDIPPGFDVEYAAGFVPVTVGFSDFDGELWAEPGATARTGRWFTVRRSPIAAALPFVAPNSYRVSLPDADAAVAPPTTGRPTTLVQVAGSGVLTDIEAFGFADTDLLGLITAVASGSNDLGIVGQNEVFRRLVAQSGASSRRLVDRVLSIVGPPSLDSPIVGPTTLVLTVSAQQSINRRLEAFLLTDPQRMAIGDDTAAVAGHLAGRPGEAMVTWLDDNGWELVLQGQLPLDQLIALAGTVRADDRLWDLFSAAPSPRSPVSLTPSPEVPVTTVSVSDRQWAIALTPYVEAVTGRHWLTWSATAENTAGSDFLDADVPFIDTVVIDDATIVFASAPVAAGAVTLRLQVGDGAPTDVAMATDSTGTGGLTTAVAAFGDIAGYTAQILDAAGTVLATWPATPG